MLLQILLYVNFIIEINFIVKDPAIVKFFTKLLNFSPSSTKTLFTINVFLKATKHSHISCYN